MKVSGIVYMTCGWNNTGSLVVSLKCSQFTEMYMSASMSNHVTLEKACPIVTSRVAEF